MAGNSFAHYEVEDDVVSNILVRAAIVRRVPSEKLIAFVLEKVKPLMGAEEILHLDVEIELALEEAERLPLRRDGQRAGGANWPPPAGAGSFGHGCE